MEFRKYDKLNCTLFDLISGDLEPKQTIALGFLLAKSNVALKRFLKLIKCVIKYDKVIVDCEAQRKQINNNDRIDILLRFYHHNNPQKALIVEAKSAKANISAQLAATQATKYIYGFSQLNDFAANIETISLTREVKNITQSISISWSELITNLFEVSSKDKLIKDFINFFLNIKGSMKYYDEEILSIPAKDTYDAIMKSGIYECPNDYKSRKRSLFITFRAEKGRMDLLYKLKDVVELDVNDNTAINVVNNSLPDFASRLSTYKQIVNSKKNKKVSGEKRVYILDMDHPIKLPVPIRPIENNASPAYYTFQEFFGNVNSNIGCIIVHKDINIDGDAVQIMTNGKKTYELKDNSGNELMTFSRSGRYSPLKKNTEYVIHVSGTNRNVQLKKIQLKYLDNKWVEFFVFDD